MTFRVQAPEGTIVCRSERWGDFNIEEYPASASRYVEGLLITCGWGYGEETPYHILWNKIVPEDKPALIPHIIHGIAVVDSGADELWKLIKDFPLSQLDLCALYLAATRGNKDTRSVRAWLAGIEFPPRAEIVKALLATPLYVGVAVARASSDEIPDMRVSREVAEAILRELPNAYWTAQDWIRLIANSGYSDLLSDYENNAQLSPVIQEYHARDAARAWNIFQSSGDANARATALHTLVRIEHPRRVDAVRTALQAPSALVREAAFENLDMLPREEYARWLVHFAYHGIPGDHGETRRRAWYKIEQLIPEAEFAELLAQKLR
jgi:hypothetical protein